MIVTVLTKTGMESYMFVETAKYDKEAGIVKLVEHNEKDVTINDVIQCSIYTDTEGCLGHADNGSLGKKKED
jgi:hypothetical protein